MDEIACRDSMGYDLIYRRHCMLQYLSCRGADFVVGIE